MSQENEEYEEDEQGGASGKKRPTKKKPGSAGAAKKAKKERPARVVLPPLREHGFGDLTRFAPPPKNPASSFMQFSRKYRAGKERGKAPNARHVSETWNQMSEEQRKPFVDLAEEDKRRVQAEIDVYMAQYPDDLKTLDDFKLLVSVMREKEKRDRGEQGKRFSVSFFVLNSSSLQSSRDFARRRPCLRTRKKRTNKKRTQQKNASG